MNKLNLLTFIHQLDELHKLVDGKTGRVTVDVQLLRSLLLDHSAMYNALKQTQIKVSEPKVREKLN
jgi:hypothetical protein